jgi:hypothetical protein
VASTHFTVLESIEHQAGGCERAGSALYAALLRGLADDHRAGGITAALLEGVSDQPVHDAVPLRYLATAHRLALAGDAPDLAAQYPSCGGSWSPADGGGDLTATFLRTVADHRDEMVAGLRRNVQTNEVGRATVITAGLSWIVEQHALPVRTLEIGASAGLLSRWPHYAYDTGASSTGDPSSALRFDASWYLVAPPLRPDLRAVECAASDISPIDASSPSGRLTMLSFLWPDQHERRARLIAALDIAAEHPVAVERADAGAWLHERLSAGLPHGVATVVYHSIVWQYLPRPTRDGVRGALRVAGEGTTSAAPLCWLRMEPATPEHADLRVTTWPGGEEVVLAEVGYHGGAIRWLR